MDHLTDQELLDLFQNGDEEAANVLLGRYKSLVSTIARSYYLKGAQSEDVLQEGMIGLFRALQTYSSEKAASFSTYASVCIKNSIRKAIEASDRQKHKPLNEYISLDQTDGEDADSSLSESSEEALLRSSPMSPEEIMIDRESTEQIRRRLDEKLSALEKEVLLLYLSGKDYHEIAKTLNCSDKQIDNALQRIRTKTKKLMGS